jgi:hypothetical protein
MQQLFWSAVRLVVVLWMITRGVPWTDHRVWYLTGAALAYWLYEGYTHWSAENEARESRRRRAERAAAAAGPDAAEADAPLHAAAAAHAAVAGIRIRPPGAPAAARRQSILLRIPYLHMDVDAEQLRVHLHFAGPGLRREEPDVVELRPEPRSHPTAVVRQLALGVALWAVTLIPAFEAMRAREIRSRERTMRAVVVALNPEESQEQNQSQNQEDENTEQESDAPPPPPRELVLPSGLSVQARKYYLRVASTTEAIDWEEEREAQRAMGIPDEEEDARAGFIGGLL